MTVFKNDQGRHQNVSENVFSVSALKVSKFFSILKPSCYFELISKWTSFTITRRKWYFENQFLFPSVSICLYLQTAIPRCWRGFDTHNLLHFFIIVLQQFFSMSQQFLLDKMVKNKWKSVQWQRPFKMFHTCCRFTSAMIDLSLSTFDRSLEFVFNILVIVE